MNRRKLKNPLLRRIPRELTGDWRKYLVVSLFLILTIGFVSGMFVANESMMAAAENGVSKYHLEDGHFELREKAERSLISDISSGEKADPGAYFTEDEKEKESDLQPVPVRIYENFYRTEEEDPDRDSKADGSIRVFLKTEEINLACLLEGEFPEAEDEIAIDRMHADNAGISVGDKIRVGSETFRVAGLLAYVNYSTLYEKNTDMMFDALKFDVAMVTEEGFDRFDSDIHYHYAWEYKTEPEDTVEEKEMADHFLSALVTQTIAHQNEVVDFLPAYANQAIQFAPNDMGSDMAMGGTVLQILIVIIAFIFAVTISNTISRESRTIGTLRASGYTKGELIRHYMVVPVIVTIVSAVIGNLLGYTVFKKLVVSMYYNSYSLPVYETIWSPDAFVKTTVIPVILMFLINSGMIVQKLQHTPLEFLRGNLKKDRRKEAIRLPDWKFFHRFRLRIMFQNLPNYAILCLGVFFVAVLLGLAVGMPETLDYYKKNAEDMMLAKYQYVLKTFEDENGEVIVTNTEDAEPYCVKSLQKKGDAVDEEISVYGMIPDSRYGLIDDLESLEEGEVYLSDSFGEKYHISVGDTVTLDEKYEDRKYTFRVAGFYDKAVSLSVYMPISRFRSIFDLGEDEISGYLSDVEITDIEEEKIATVITERDITKMTDQLDHSMGAYMRYFQVLCILLSAVLIYLLTKIIIEKNENAISMTKILGYENREIASLYLKPTTVILLISDMVGVVLGFIIVSQVWGGIMSRLSGWYSFRISPLGYAKMFLFILIGYTVVLWIDFGRIKKISMDEALKHVE